MDIFEWISLVSLVQGICEPNYIYVRGKSSLYTGHSWPLMGNPHADAASRYVMSFYEHKCCLASSGNHNGCLDQYEFNRHWGIERYRSFRDYCELAKLVLLGRFSQVLKFSSQLLTWLMSRNKERTVISSDGPWVDDAVRDRCPTRRCVILSHRKKYHISPPNGNIRIDRFSRFGSKLGQRSTKSMKGESNVSELENSGKLWTGRMMRNWKSMGGLTMSSLRRLKNKWAYEVRVSEECGTCDQKFSKLFQKQVNEFTVKMI